MQQAFIIVGNGSHECENATEQNEQYLASSSMLRPYYGLMIGLTLANCLLNLTCLLTFRLMRPRRRFNFLLARLSMVETLFQGAFFCNQALVLAMDSNLLLLPSRHLAFAAAALLPISMFLCTTLHVARNWAVVLIGRHRWLAVVRSDRAAADDAGSASDRRLLAGGAILCACVALPRLFEFQPVVCEPVSQVTHVDARLSGLPVYRLAYLGGLLCLFQNAGPILCLAFFSLDLARRLARQSRRRLSVLGCRSRRAPWGSGNRTVLLLCLLFCLCEWPTLLKSLDPATVLGWAMALVANLLTCLDSSLNIFVYHCSHKGFGQALSDLLHACCCWCRGDSVERRRRSRSRSLSVAIAVRRQSKHHQQLHPQHQLHPLTSDDRDPSIELLSATA